MINFVRPALSTCPIVLMRESSSYYLEIILLHQNPRVVYLVAFSF